MWEKNLERYDALVTMYPAIKRKGKTMPYTSDNGYMFSLLNKAGELGIRLPKADGKQFMETHNTTIFKSHGAVMKDYVLIPEHLLDDLNALLPYLKKGHEYVLSLPPK